MRKLVSIIIPVFNKVQYLDDCIQSAVALNYRPLDVVIVDDQSSDGSYEKAMVWREQHPDTISVLRPEAGRNRGPGATRNLGLRNCAGEYVCFLDADDTLLPDRLSVATGILDKKDDVDCVFEAVRVELETPASASAWRNKPTHWSVPTREDVDPAIVVLEKQCYWHTNAVLCRRTVFDKSGLFNEWVRRAEDSHMWLKVAMVATLEPGRLSEPISVVRRADHHTWNPSRSEDTFRDVGISAMVFVWAIKRKSSIPKEKMVAFKKGVRAQLSRAVRILREEGCCWRACAVAPAALLVPQVLKERAFWGNLVYCFTDKLSTSKRKTSS